MKETIKDKIIKVLKEVGKPLAEHEFPYVGTNGSGLSACLRRIRDRGLVQARRRHLASGEMAKFKEWFLPEMFPAADRLDQDQTNSDCDKDGKYKYRGV
jgi:hypothetical protein